MNMCGIKFLVIGNYEPKRLDVSSCVEHLGATCLKYEMNGVWLDLPPEFWAPSSSIVVESDRIFETYSDAHKDYMARSSKATKSFNQYVSGLGAKRGRTKKLIPGIVTRDQMAARHARIMRRLSDLGLRVINGG